MEELITMTVQRANVETDPTTSNLSTPTNNEQSYTTSYTQHKFIIRATAEHKHLNLMCEWSLGGKGMAHVNTNKQSGF